MNTAATFRRFLAILCLGLILTNPLPVQADCGASPAGSPVATTPNAATSYRVHANNKLFDYIRGNRSRMVQVATIALGIGLVILMTATRKS